MLRDPHDPRQFRQLIRLAEDGTVASTHEFAAGSEPPEDLIDITDLAPQDLSSVKIDPAIIGARAQAAAVVADLAVQLAAAKQAHQDAHVDVAMAVGASMTK